MARDARQLRQEASEATASGKYKRALAAYLELETLESRRLIVRFERRPDGGFTASYGREGRLVGVLAHGDDDAYDRGRELIKAGAAWS